MVVLFATVTAVAGMPPRATVAGAVNPAPVMVTAVPPAVVPAFGLMPVTCVKGNRHRPTAASISGETARLTDRGWNTLVRGQPLSWWQ